MVLNGVGGRTVAEAKEAVTHEESLLWQAFMQRRGSLHLGMRLESGFALLAHMVNRALGGHASIEDYMLHGDEKEASIDDVMKILASGAKRG